MEGVRQRFPQPHPLNCIATYMFVDFLHVGEQLGAFSSSLLIAGLLLRFSTSPPQVAEFSACCATVIREDLETPTSGL